MLRLLFFWGAFWGVFPNLLGQDTSSIIPRFTLKTNLVPLIQPFKRAAVLAAEYRLRQNLTTELSVGYFFESRTFARYEGEHYRGPRLRLNLKYYAPLASGAAFFAGIGGKYQRIDHQYFELYERQGAQYFEQLPQQRNVSTFGAALQFGFQVRAGWQDRFLLEFFSGVGGAWHEVSLGPIPADARNLDSRRGAFNVFRYDTGRSGTLDFLFGIQMGYVLAR
jgi:hypothetical protein